MNPAIGPEPTDFDRAGAIVAFQRTPGNRSPDVGSRRRRPDVERRRGRRTMVGADRVPMTGGATDPRIPEPRR